MTVIVKGIPIELENVGLAIYNQGRADAIEEIFKGIYEHFEKHHIEVFGKDEVLDELILFLDEYYVYTKVKEKLKEQRINENNISDNTGSDT